jgi:NTE family protein
MPRVALVLPGGGARGAYEAGALSVLLPLLERRGEVPVVVCGTSVGAINAALLASVAHESAEVQAQALVDRWSSLKRGQVIRRIVGPASVKTLVKAGAGLAGIKLGGPTGLLDPAPLTKSLGEWVDWERLHRNVTARHLDAVCAVATSLERGGAVAFIDTAGTCPTARPGDDLAYEPVALNIDHVRASAAIPFVFPPVLVREPKAVAGYYIDGGTRLNSPLKPALRLGAERVIVVGFAPFGPAPARPGGVSRRPSLADVASNVLDGLLVDQVGADLHRAAAINANFVEGSLNSPAAAARRYRAGGGNSPYRRISYALVAPQDRSEVADIAERVVRRQVGGLRALRDPEHALLARLLGMGGRGAELLSFLLFDGEFAGELIEAGRRDAQRWIDRHPALWCADGRHDFDLLPGDPEREHEVSAVEEWRSLRRR